MWNTGVETNNSKQAKHLLSSCGYNHLNLNFYGSNNYDNKYSLSNIFQDLYPTIEIDKPVEHNHAYNNLEAEKILTGIDYIVLCVPSWRKLPSFYGVDIPINIKSNVYDTPSEVEKNDILHTLNEIGNKRANLLYNAAELYFKDAMDIEFHKLIHDGLLELIDELMFKFNIKCVYLKCEDSSFHNYVPKYGPVSNLSIKEVYTSDNSLSTTENNKILTRLIIDIIKNDSFDRKTIRMEDYFFFKDGK